MDSLAALSEPASLIPKPTASPATRDHNVDPRRQRVQQFGTNCGILPARARGHVKRMIRILKQLESCALTELFAERLQKLHAREIITSPLQEEHRYLHIEQVLSALLRWLAGWMKRESEKHKAAHSGQTRCRLRLRRHSAAEGFAAGKKSKFGTQLGCFRYRRADCGMSQFRSVRPFRALLHVGKLIPQCGNAALRKPVRGRGHERMRHAG